MALSVLGFRAVLAWGGMVGVLVGVASCAPSLPKGGGYYGGDRPPELSEFQSVDLDAVPDAVPVDSPLSRTGNRPYSALGKVYRPLASEAGFVERGVASWYGKKFHGRRTSSGETYDMFAMTAAHPILPLPSFVRVRNLENGKEVVVKVNDRGPFLHGRVIDLSYAAAHRLGIAQAGTGRVEVTALEVGRGGGQAVVNGGTGREQIALQVGAYGARGNAVEMRQRLVGAGYAVMAVEAGGGVYRVRVGPFTSHRVAQREREKLEAMLGHSVSMIILQ